MAPSESQDRPSPSHRPRLFGRTLPWLASLTGGAVPGLLLVALAGITLLYVVSAELMKAWFYRRPG